MRVYSVATAILAFAAAQVNIAYALPSTPPTDFKSGAIMARDMSALTAREASLAPIDARSPAEGSLDKRDSKWNAANQAITDWAGRNLPIPILCASLVVAGDKVYFYATSEVSGLQQLVTCFTFADPPFRRNELPPCHA